MKTRQTALRLLTHASLRLQSHDNQSLDDAHAYLVKALVELEGLRFPLQDSVSDSLKALLKEKP